MKKFNEYLTESTKEYTYRIKVAGEFTSETYDKLKAALDQFHVVSCTKSKTSPIQSEPAGFPGLNNQEVSVFEVTVEYPTSQDAIVQLARVAGIEQNNIIVIDADFDDSMAKERDAVEDGTRLETEDYPKDTQEHKDANDEYADSYQAAAKTFAGEADTDFEIAGGKTAPAKYNTDKKGGGEDSPMSKVSRKSLSELLK